MRKQSKHILIFLVAVIVFVLRVIQGLSPAEPVPGMMLSGAMNEPIAVVFSALLLSGLTWVLLELLFRFLAKMNNKRS